MKLYNAIKITWLIDSNYQNSIICENLKKYSGISSFFSYYLNIEQTYNALEGVFVFYCSLWILCFNFTSWLITESRSYHESHKIIELKKFEGNILSSALTLAFQQNILSKVIRSRIRESSSVNL